MTGRIIRFEPHGPAGQGLACWPEIPHSEITAYLRYASELLQAEKMYPLAFPCTA